MIAWPPLCLTRSQILRTTDRNIISFFGRIFPNYEIAMVRSLDLRYVDGSAGAHEPTTSS